MLQVMLMLVELIAVQLHVGGPRTTTSLAPTLLFGLYCATYMPAVAIGGGGADGD